MVAAQKETPQGNANENSRARMCAHVYGDASKRRLKVGKQEA